MDGRQDCYNRESEKNDEERNGWNEESWFLTDHGYSGKCAKIRNAFDRYWTAEGDGCI